MHLVWMIGVMLAASPLAAQTPRQDTAHKQAALEAISRNLPMNIQQQLEREGTLEGKNFNQRLNIVVPLLQTAAEDQPFYMQNVHTDLASLRSRSPSPAAQAAIGQVYLSLGEANTALEIANQQTGANPEDGRGQLLKAQALRKLGRYEEARAAATLAQTDPRTRSRAAALLRLREGDGGGTPAPASVGTQRRTGRPHNPGRRLFSNLNATQRDRLNRSIVVLGRSETGKQILKLAVPNAQGVYDVTSLEDGGIAFMIDETGAVTGHAKVEAAQGRRAETMNITQTVVFNPRSLAREHPELLAALVGEKVDNVNWMRKWGSKISDFGMTLYGRVKRMLITEEVGANTTPVAGQSDLQNEVNFDHFMLTATSADLPAGHTFGDHSTPAVHSYMNNFYRSGRGMAIFQQVKQSHSAEIMAKSSQQWYIEQLQSSLTSSKALIQAQQGE
jgi:tetratricopeptide (TPR) repeat protein